MAKDANINKHIFKKCRRLFWNDPKKIMLYSIIKKVFPYTLAGYITLAQVCDAIDEIERRGVNGSIVEMGCWNGGLGSLMAWRAKKHKKERPVWLFDSFQGLPGFSEADKEKADKKGIAISDTQTGDLTAIGVFKAEQAKVKAIAAELGVSDMVLPVKGWFQDTIPQLKHKLGSIALLYLDADIYESTKYCLDELYDLVAPEGMIVLDDYETWSGSRKALYEFFSARGIHPSIKYYPYGGRPYFIKK